MKPILILSASLTLGICLYLFGEFVRRKVGYSNEASRKLFHIISAFIAVSWAFFLGYKIIITVEIIFIVFSLLARKYRWFKWLFEVGRESWGEIFYAMGVIFAALFAKSGWVYAAAILIVGLADAAAALIGRHFGKSNEYRVFGHKKSVAGSSAFYLVSLSILSLIMMINPDFASGNWHVIIWLPLVATFIENTSPYGLDNLLVPIVVIAILNLV